MERLRTRVSPIPASSSNVFPTVLEEPITPLDENNPESGIGSGRRRSKTEFCAVGESPTESNGHVFRKHRRRLPLVQPISRNSRSSRSFDSGISCLLSSEPGSPGPNSNSDHIGSPNHISSRQSYISSPCNSPGPRSPRLGMVRNPLSPRPHVPAGFCGFFPRRFSEQTESYPNSTKSSDDSDSSPPTTEPSPPPNGGSSSPPPTSPILRVSRRMLPETPKSPYNVWQQSRDSLDSGVYSRSTTCDSFPGRNNPGSPVLSSTSPPTLTRHSWRRGGVARLPEPPINNHQDSTSSFEDHKRVHFETNQLQNNSGISINSGIAVTSSVATTTTAPGTCSTPPPLPVSGSPAKSRSVSLLTSLKNTYQAKLDHSPVKSGTSGIFKSLHEKLAATRSSPVPGSTALSSLDVPKLRDLKSHSFPPIPFTTTNNLISENATNETTKSDTYPSPVVHQEHPSSIIDNLCSKNYDTSHYYYDTEDTEELTSYIVESTDDRRRKWLLSNHNTYTG